MCHTIVASIKGRDSMDIRFRSIHVKALFAFAFMLVFACALSLSSADDSIGDTSAPVVSGDYTYTYDTETGEATITKAGSGLSGEITIPSVLDEWPVVALGERAFYNNSKVTAVTIPSTIRSVGNEAFYNSEITSVVFLTDSGNGTASIGNSVFRECDKLVSVTLPSTLTSMGTDVFRASITLPTVLLPQSLASISDNTFYGCSALKSVVIPASVTSIGKQAFYNSGIESISIPDGVETIGNSAFLRCLELEMAVLGSGITALPLSAFSDCSSLTSVSLPSGLITIWGSAFYGCSSLESLVIPDSVESIGDSVFYECSKLTGLVLPSGMTEITYRMFTGYSVDAYVIPSHITTIEANAFEETQIRSITIPSSVTSLGDNAFKNARNLDNVSIPSSIKVIRMSTFQGCTGLKSVSIPGTVTNIGDSAFSGCTGLVSMYLSDSVISMGTGVFSGCSSLSSLRLPSGLTSIPSSLVRGTAIEEISIPAGVVSIGDRAFRESALKKITLPTAVRTIGEYAFQGCGNLDDVVFHEGLETLGAYLFESSSVKSVTFPSTVTVIPDYCFYSCSSLVSVTLPSTLTTISRYAFKGCVSLESITIPDSVQSLDSNAFLECASLKTVHGGRGIGTIGSYAFSYCISLTSFSLPDDVASLGSYAFSNCKELTTFHFGRGFATFDQYVFTNDAKLSYITVDEDNEKFSVKDNILYDDVNKAVVFAPQTVSGRVEILNGTLSVSKDVFDKRTGITEVVFPDGFKSIGSVAFRGCTSLGSVTFPGTLESIDYNAFDGCTSLTSVLLPDSLRTTGNYLFKNCTSLTTATIPAGMTSMGVLMFTGCTSLSDVTLKNGITVIPQETFFGCTSLTGLTIPASVTSIGSSAFHGCTSLVNVNIPANVTTIGDSAFSGCPITTVVIPEGVTSIKYDTFAGCSSLSNVTIPSTVTEIAVDAFKDCVSLRTISLPDGLKKLTGFKGCTSLESVVIPDGVIELNAYAFQGCTSLHTVVMPSGITIIFSSAFDGCCSLRKMTIPANVTSIGDYAFRDCSNLVELTLPDGLKTIGNRAFANCDGIMSLTIPSSLTSLGSYAFIDNKIRELINESNVGYGQILSGGVMYKRVVDKGVEKLYGVATFEIMEDGGFQYAHYTKAADPSIHYYELLSYVGDDLAVTLPGPEINCVAWTAMYVRGLIDVTIPSGADYSGFDYMFDGATGLRSVTFPAGFTDIPDYCFRGCDSLKSVTVPASVTSIGTSAFGECDNLTSVTFESGSSQISIGSHLFSDCPKLTAVVLPECLTAIEANMFSKCESLESIAIPSNVVEINMEAFAECTHLASVTIPAGVTLIGDRAFQMCGALASVTFENGSQLESIGEYAFYECSSITSIAIPSNVRLMDRAVFMHCFGLESVSIPAGLEVLPDSMFDECASLEVVAFEQGSILKTIGSGAFARCDSLAAIVLPSGVETIGSAAFYDCGALLSVTLPDDLKTIGDNAFGYCDTLWSIILPAGLESIGASAFALCSMECIVIPGSVTSIGKDAFSQNNAFFTILGEPDSYAEMYAFDNKLPFELTSGIRDTRLTVEFDYEGDVNPYLGLLVAVLGRDDGSKVFRAVGSTQTVVLGLSSIQEYTVQVVSESGAVIAEVEDVSFTDGLASCTIDTTKPIFDLTLIVKNSNGDVIADGYTVAWSMNGTPIGDTNVMRDVTAGTSLTYYVALGSGLLQKYEQPAAVDLTVSGSTVELVLTDIEMARIDCDVTSGPISQTRVAMNVMYEINGSTFSTTVFDLDGDGVFSVEVPIGSDVQLTFSNLLHYTHIETVDGIDSDTELDVSLVELNPGCEIGLIINEIRAVADGEPERREQAYLDYYGIEVINTVSGRQMDAVEIRYNRIYLMEGDAEDGDRIEIRVRDVRGMFLPGVGSLVFSSEGTNSVEIDVTELGGIRVEETEGNATDIVMLFDAYGGFIDSTVIGSDNMFENLPGGVYKAVFIADNNVIPAVQSLKDLDDYNLSKGTDYILVQVSVSDGTISVITGDAPEFPEGRLPYLDLDVTSMDFNKSRMSIGENVTLRIEYGFDSSGIADLGDARLSIAIPDGMNYMIGSAVSIDGTKLTASLSGGILDIEVGGDLDGVVMIVLRAIDGTGDKTASGTILVEIDESERAYPVGSDTVHVVTMDLEAPDTTSNLRIHVSGKTSPGTVVDLFVDGEYSTTAVSNAVGSYQSWVDLPERASEGIVEYALQAQAFLDDGSTIRSGVETVLYQESNVTIKKATLNAMSSITVDFTDPPSHTPVYSFARGNTITFSVEIIGEVSDVFVIVESSKGGIKEIPCSYNGFRDCWVGSTYCLNEGWAPTSMAVSCKEGILTHRTYTQPLRYILDPSGVVYEGVLSNPLEGVTATLYQKIGSTIIRWDAENYSQINPVITGSDGYYEWYVPDGLWMVEYKKDGYVTAYSDWMLVPPPRTNVNVCMISLSSPVVTSIIANSGSIDIVFSQYMNVNSVISQNITVRMGGSTITGTVAPVDAEASPLNPNLELAKVFRFTPATELSGNVDVTVKDAANYAGNIMASNHTSQVSVTPVVSAITAPADASAYLDMESSIIVQLDANVSGRTIDVFASASDFISILNPTVTTDANGRATIRVVGLMEGSVGITYVLRDTGITASTMVAIEEGEPCEHHEFGEWASVDDQSHERECVVCHYIESVSHAYGEGIITIEPTCSAEGTRSYTCSVCNHVKTEAIPMLPHTYGEWIVDVEPTETTPGEKHRTCTVCGHTESGSIAPHVHTYSVEWEHDGTTHFHACTECGSKKDVSAHEFGEWSIVREATESAEGEESRTCPICGYSETKAIPKIDSDDDKGGLSGGAIAGIAVGALAVIGAGAFAVFRFVIGKK